MTILEPGAMIGMLGGGQLGRMTSFAARAMGYRVAVLDPAPHSPAGQVADRQIVAPYDDRAALALLADVAEVISIEFENLPVVALEELAEHRPVRPSAQVLRATQDRLAERALLRRLGIPTARSVSVRSPQDVPDASILPPFPAVLKTARFGYDSKGQLSVACADEVSAACALLGGVSCLLEEVVRFEREVSVIVARSVSRQIATYEPAENVHVGGILDTSMAPAPLTRQQRAEIRDIAVALAEDLDLVGLLAMELFVLPDGRLLVNELAPRPHNSGHWSIEACRTSQFQQHARLVVGAPVGSIDLLAPAATCNLLGDLWQSGPPRWDRVLALPDVTIHLYGKNQPRPGRKMGHLTALGSDAETARARVVAARALLTGD